jgi:hypothetical protein
MISMKQGKCRRIDINYLAITLYEMGEVGKSQRLVVVVLRRALEELLKESLG